MREVDRLVGAGGHGGEGEGGARGGRRISCWLLKKGEEEEEEEAEAEETWSERNRRKQSGRGAQESRRLGVEGIEGAGGGNVEGKAIARKGLIRGVSAEEGLVAVNFVAGGKRRGEERRRGDMETVDNQALETLISITGVTEAAGARLLQASRGDLNAAVNSFFNEGDDPVPHVQIQDLELDSWMEEDEPPMRAAGPSERPVVGFGGSINPFGLPTSTVNSWEGSTFNPIGQPGRRSNPFGGSATPFVSHPPAIRNIPIEWRDGDDGPPLPAFRPSNPRIEEIPGNFDIQQLPARHVEAMVDEEVPSTASSMFRPTGEQTEALRFRGSPDVVENLDSDFNPNAPRIAEVPVIGNDEDSDIDEEMLRAAIEASRQEAEEASRRVTDYPQDAIGGNPPERFSVMRTTEDDDLARAVTLSLKTAEQEKAMRERSGASSQPVFMQEDEDDPSSEDIQRLDSMRRRGIARDRAGMTRGGSSEVGVTSSSRDKERKSSGGSAGFIISNPPEETEEAEEQPLLRRRTSRRSMPITTEPGVVTDEGVQIPIPRGLPDLRDSLSLPSAPPLNSGDEAAGLSGPSRRDGDTFPSDEWGGISSEEHDEAVMLEAAIFGGLPEGQGLGLPYQARRGLRSDMMDGVAGGESAGLIDNFTRRGLPQPPSPTVVAQRLLREQQDDEYLASLAADREKELKAQQEAEARRLEEQEAAVAAESQEKLRQEEVLRREAEAQELEKQLALKKENLPREPAADEEGAVTLVVRLPDGSRRGRRFHKFNKLQSLFDFIDIGQAVKPGSYRLVRQFPRVAFTDGQHSSSLESLGLTSKQEVLLLELI